MEETKEIPSRLFDFLEEDIIKPMKAIGFEPIMAHSTETEATMRFGFNWIINHQLAFQANRELLVGMTMRAKYEDQVEQIVDRVIIFPTQMTHFQVYNDLVFIYVISLFSDQEYTPRNEGKDFISG